VIFASAPSQEAFLAALTGEPGIDWSAVQVFHMDEYIGLEDGAAQSFGRWIATRLASVRPGRLELLQPGDDPDAEARRYASALAEAPIDLVCLGVGVNGHIAFNEPDLCRFDDLEMVRQTTLTPASRQQQVDDGCFGALDDVPVSALTLTIPALMSSGSVVAVVPGGHKADAVGKMLAGEVSEAVPASALRRHPQARMYLDTQAASKLPLANGGAR
jgi:glucosamine-6-phosphate deaminase